MPFHILNSGLRQRIHTKTSPLEVVPPPLEGTAELWIDNAALMLRPTTGALWDDLVVRANLATVSGADLKVAGNNHPRLAYAAALVGVRTNNAAMKQLATDAIANAIGTEAGAQWMTAARNIGAYVIAASILDIRSGPIYTWFTSLRTMALTDDVDATQQRTFRQVAWATGNSTSAREGYAYLALCIHLGDWAEVAWNWQAYSRYVGDRTSTHSLLVTNSDWQQYPLDPVGLQNNDALASNGIEIDGMISEEMARDNPVPVSPPVAGSFAFGPNTALSGLAIAALLFYRQGYPAFTLADEALRRAHTTLFLLGSSWYSSSATPDSKWILNTAYALSYSVISPVSYVTLIGFTDWTHPTVESLLPGTPVVEPPFTGTLYYVSPSGGGNGTSPTSRWTLAQANSNAVANSRIMMAGGTYGTDILPTNNGTSDQNRITYMAESGATPTLNGKRATLSGKSYITIKGIKIISVKLACVVTDNASTRITVDQCQFENSTVYDGVETGWSTTMVVMRGSWGVVRNCSFKQWTHSDTLSAYGSRHLIEGNDLNRNDSGHGSIQFYCRESVCRLNYVRNKWSGGREIVGRPEGALVVGAETGANNLYEDNIGFDINLVDTAANEGYPIMGWGITNQGVSGDAQDFKLGGDGTIFRNNLLVGGNETTTHTETDYPYKAVCHIGNYGYSTHWRHLRIYHNTLYENFKTGFALTYNSANPMYAEDNRWLNNIIDKSGMYDFFINSNTGAIYDTWQWHKNIFTGKFRDRILTTTFYNTFALWETAWKAAKTGRNGLVTGNIITAPIFESPSYTVAHNDRNQKISRSNFLLKSGSVGKGVAMALATVTTASSGTTITLSDCRVFYPDNYGVVPGDIIRIGTATRRVMTRNLSTNQITVDAAITLAGNESVWLNKYGTSPDIGIQLVSDGVVVASAVEPAAAIAAPIALWSGVTATSGTTFSTSSFSLSPNSLNFVIVSYLAGSAALVPPTLTLTGTHTGLLSPWDKVAERKHDAATDTCIALWTARTGSSPTSGTLTLTGDAAFTQAVVGVCAWPSLGTNGNLVQVTTGTNTAADISLALATPLTTGNVILGALNSRASQGVTPGTGFTELLDLPSSASSNAHLQIQYKLSSTNGTSSWAGAEALKRNVYFVAEFARG